MKTRNFGRLVATLLTTMLLVAVTMVTAMAVDNVTYQKATVDSDGTVTFDTETISAEAITTTSTALGGDEETEYWYVVSDTSGVTITDRITVTGDVHLILVDGTTLNAEAGITVEGENNLTIYAQSTGDTMGKLVATAATSTSAYNPTNAGIGGTAGNSAGTITINGGNITATGGSGTSSNSSGAGIGGGASCESTAGAGGIITINGGIVTASGGGIDRHTGTGAGIGGGGSYSSTAGAGGTITINGGTITATGGTATYGASSGAGIGGGGSRDSAAGSGGNITINGGDITAEGGNTVGTAQGYTSSTGAGIGGGGSRGNVAGSGGTVSVNGGAVTATGGADTSSYAASGAGIGGGGTYSGTAGSGGTVSITGGTVTASGGTTTTSNSGAAIGSGKKYNTTLSVSGTVTIKETMGYGTNSTDAITTYTISDGAKITTFPTDQYAKVLAMDWSITTQPTGSTYTYGDTVRLTIAATGSTDGIGYQWYSCDDDDGSNAQKIENETSETYTPSNLDAGTYYYYCTLSSTDAGTTVTATSDIATVTINKADQEAPTGTVTVTSTYNATNDNYDIEITSHTDSTYEYAFQIGTDDVGSYSSLNTTTVDIDDTTVTAYVRKAKTNNYNASDAIYGEVTTGTSIISAAITTAMGLINSNSFTDLTNTVTTEADAETAIETQVKAISEIVLTGITVTVNTISFTAAIDGDYADNDGTEGSYTFTVTLTATEFSDVTVTASESDTVKIAAVAAATLTDTVEITGNAIYDSTLTADVSQGNGTGTYTYAWYRSGTDDAIQTGTSNTYTLVTADIGYTITVKVNTTDQAGQVTDTSDTIAKITNEVSDTSISGWTYGDTPNEPTVSAATDGEVYYVYSTTEDGTYTETVPTDAGTYWVKAVVDTTTNYTSAESTAVSFTIEKATVTITADDQSAYRGYDEPSYTYAYDGFLDGDSFSEEPVFGCDSGTTTSGTFEIVMVSEAKETSGNYAFVYVGGTLTVTTKSNYTPSTSTTTTTTTTDTTTNDDGSVTATASASTASSGTTVTVTVSDSNMETAIENAGEADEGEGLYVEIEATTKSSTDTVVATFSTDAAEALVDSNVDALLITSDLGTVTISHDALDSIASQADDADITIAVEYLDVNDLTDEQKAAIGDGFAVNLTVTSGGEVISSFGGYEIIITIPYQLKDGESTENIVVWHVADNGTVTVMDTAYDEETGMATFVTTHFSVFAVMHDTNIFTDIDPNDYYYDAVLWAVENGITAGTTTTTFSPDTTCTRAQAVTFLWRAAGEPVVNFINPFTDVDADSYYYEAVLWAVSEGITAGTSDTTFSPNGVCSRSQIVTFLYRATGEPEVTGDCDFTDVSTDSYYYNAVLWAVENGITSGTTTTTFSPSNDCTRGQIVTFLYRNLAE